MLTVLPSTLLELHIISHSAVNKTYTNHRQEMLMTLNISGNLFVTPI